MMPFAFVRFAHKNEALRALDNLNRIVNRENIIIVKEAEFKRGETREKGDENRERKQEHDIWNFHSGMKRNTNGKSYREVAAPQKNELISKNVEAPYDNRGGESKKVEEKTR